MIDALALIVIGAVILIIAMIIKGAQENRQTRAITHSPTQALTTGDVWYKQALNMARLLERMNSDPMVSCTFDERTKQETQRVLQKFWSDHELGE